MCTSFITAQTSWTGADNTKWSDKDNWTDGTPNKNDDVIIGDANFTGAYQPELKGKSGKCNNLTIGNSTKVSELTLSSNLTISGDLIIGSNGTILHDGNNRDLSLEGNWFNSGIYSCSGSNSSVEFNGSSQAVTGVTEFKNIEINYGSTLTLIDSISVSDEIEINGTFDPTATLCIYGNGDLSVESRGIIHVKTENFSENYKISGAISLDGSSTVDYSSSDITQNISSDLTYGTLLISGGTTKYLTADLPSLYSLRNKGQISIEEGTLDLQTYTANRGTGSGGNFTLAEGTTLKIGGTNGFPENYSNINVAQTSTIEYYGENQDIEDLDYGNLLLKSSSGLAVKTMPSSSFKVYGDFISSVGDGSGVTINTNEDIKFYGAFELNEYTTFNASSYYFEFKSNFENNGTFNGQTSQIRFLGTNSEITGSGTNVFNDVHFSRPGITASNLSDFQITGNLKSDWGGNFSHNSGGTITMSGSSKEISGNDIDLSNLSITGTINTNTNIDLSGNLLIDGTYTTSNWRTLNMYGNLKTISGSGSIQFYKLNIDGTISTSNDITIKSNFTISDDALYTASEGTTTFNGSTYFSGEANLYDVTLNSSKYLLLTSNSTFNIANTFIKDGNLNATSKTPNTICYNGSVDQDIIANNYYNLEVETNGTKTIQGDTYIYNDLIINSDVTLDASSYTLQIKKDFYNYGTFNAGTSTIKLVGDFSSRIEGNTTFNILQVYKTLSSTWVFLINDISTTDLYMTRGNMDTGTKEVTITNSRTGSGTILGTITRNHSFVDATPYYFEGLNNSLTFTSPSASLNSVTVKVDVGFVDDFDNNQECVDRKYTISIPSGTYTNVDLKLHYEDNEVNAFVEPALAMYRYNTGTSAWDSIGADTRNASLNYVEKTGITDATSCWVMSGVRNVVGWNGSVSADWNDASNWNTISGSDMSNRVPNSGDAAQLGFSAFTNAPEISSNETIGVLRFGGVASCTLDLDGNTLNTIGDIRGIWSANAQHVININTGTLNVGTNLSLSDGDEGHSIDLDIGTGSVYVGYDIEDATYGEIAFSGSGLLSIGKNFNYTAGTFSAGTGTVTYTGLYPQIIAPLTYNHLTIDKTDEIATINSNALINGNLILSTGGGLELNDTIEIIGNITIGANTVLKETGTLLNIAGNFQNNGTFTASSGTVCFNGSADQTVNENTFNVLKVDKSGGILYPSDDIFINNSLSISNGTLDLLTNYANRVGYGGKLELDDNTLLKIAGADNFPENFNQVNLNSSSTVEYNGSVAQLVDSVTYGNLTFSNGGIIEKSLTGNIQVNGDFTINNGAKFNADTSIVILYGNYINNGTLECGSSTFILNGVSKTISGSGMLHLYNIYVLNGSYTISAPTFEIHGDLFVDVDGSFDLGSSETTLTGDLTNKGTLVSSGIANFTGTQIQNIQLLHAISSTSTGVINFNGSIAPVISSTSSPSFSTVNINNTAGIAPSVPWTVFVALNIASGAAFNGGSLTHTFYGDFTNNGTFTSDGLIRFIPTAPYSSGATITLDGTEFTSTGSVEFGGSVPLTIVDNGPNYNDITISNTHSSGITFTNGIYVPDNLFIAENATLNGGTSQTYTFNYSFTNNGTFEGETSTAVFNGTPSIIKGSGTYNFNNLTIDIASELQLHQEINIAGDFINNATFSPLGRTVTFNGNTSSTIGGLTTPAIFDDIEQNKTSGTTTLNVPVTINSSLTLTNGIINSSSTNLLTMADDATSSSGNATSYVSGPVKKTGNDAFVFPLGDNSVWARIGISAPSNVTDEFTAEYSTDAYTNTSDLEAPLNNVSEIEHWTLNRTTGTSNLAVTLFWEDGTLSSINNLADLMVARFDGSTWVDETQAGGTTGTTSSGTITSQSITSFSPFTFASLSESYNPLPVEWLSFNVHNTMGTIELNWATGSETNNDYFTVLKSKDGKYFNELLQVKGAGNSLSENQYSTYDKNPYEGINYYKIKQTDYNGNYKYSNIISIFVNATSLSEVQLYPNPVSLNGILNLKFGYLDSEELTIEVFNTLGLKLFTSKYETSLIKGKLLTLPVEQLGIKIEGQYYIVVSGLSFSDKKIFLVK